MRKNLLAVFLIAIMVFAAGCGGGGGADENIYARVEAAQQKLNDAGSYAMDMDMDMTMKFDDETTAQMKDAGIDSMDMTMTGTSKQRSISDTEVELEQHMTMTMMGQDMEMNQWYKDGVLYQNTMGMKQSVEMPMDEIMEQFNSADMALFTEEAIKSQSMDGNVLTFVLDGQKMSEMVDAIAGQMTAALGSDDSMSIGDVSTVVTLDDDDNMIKQEMTMNMTMNIQGTEAEIDMTVMIDNIVTEGVEITFPEDLDTYTRTTL